MEIIVTSDSHGCGQLLHEIESWYPKARLFLNCGDLEESPQHYPNWLFVRGNNDYFPGSDMPEQRILNVDGHRLLLLHSHRFSYMKREEQMAKYAMDNDCDIVCYGHTHIAKISIVNGVLLVNPGSLWMSRNGKSPSYAILKLHENGQAEAEILYEEDWPGYVKPEKKARKRFWF